MKVPLNEILVDKSFNCRRVYHPDRLTALAKSIEKNGLIQTIAVRRVDAPPYKYSLVAGFMRLMAMKSLGWTECEVNLLSDDISLEDSYALNLIENIQRTDLTFAEEAYAIGRMFDLHLSPQKVAKMIGKSVTWVNLRYNFLSLPEVIRKEVVDLNLGYTQIKDLCTVFRAAGINSLLTVFMAMKKEIQGESSSYRKTLSKALGYKKSTGRFRKPVDVHKMNEFLLTRLGPIQATRFLGWVLGDYSDKDIFDYLEVDYGIEPPPDYVL